MIDEARAEFVEPRFQPANQWSCALASIYWFLVRRIQWKGGDQQALVHQFSHLYPAWAQQPGLLSIGGMLDLLAHLGIASRKVILTKDRQEFFDFYEKNKRAYQFAFLITRKNGDEILNHCMALESWNGDSAQVMDAVRYNPRLGWIPWDRVSQKHDADILALFG